MKLDEERKHEQRVRDFLSEKATNWVNEKDRGWHFDNPENGDRYFEQQREQEAPAFHPWRDAVEVEAGDWDDGRDPRVEYQAALAAEQPVDFESPRDEVGPVRLANRTIVESIHDRPRLTPPQRIAQKMVELAQGQYGHLTVQELAALAQPPRRKPQPQPQIDEGLAAYVLRAAFGVSEVKTAEVLQQKPSKVHTDVSRLADKLPEDFKHRLTREIEARMHRKGIVVSLPRVRGKVSEKQPRE